MMDALLPIPLVNILDKRTKGLLDLWFRVLPVFIKYVFLIRGDLQKGIYYLYAIKSYFDKMVFSKVFKPCISLINLLSEV